MNPAEDGIRYISRQGIMPLKKSPKREAKNVAPKKPPTYLPRRTGSILLAISIRAIGIKAAPKTPMKNLAAKMLFMLGDIPAKKLAQENKNRQPRIILLASTARIKGP